MNTTSNPPPAHDLELLQCDYPDWFGKCFDVARSEGWVNVEGADIHYFRWGSPENPGVVMAHGFMAHARCWAFIAPLLAENYCLVALDLSGMGDSGWRASYDVQVRARECMEVARHAGLADKPTLVCHSYGGGVGITSAALYPDFWGGLIVCDMSMLAPGEPFQFEERISSREQRGVRPHRVHEDFASIRGRFRLAPDQPCANDFLMAYMARHSVKRVDGGYVWKFDPNIMGPDNERDEDWWQAVAPNFVQLNMPRGVIYGEHSQMMSTTALGYLRAESGGEIPLVRIVDAHHHVMMDQPIAVATAIDSLLQALG